MTVKTEPQVLTNRGRCTMKQGTSTAFPPLSLDYSFRVDNVRDGVQNPNWRRQVASGQNATTAMIARKHIIAGESPSFTGVVTYGGGNDWDYTWTGALFSSFDPLNLPGMATARARCESRASLNLRKKAKEKITVFTGAVFLGELRETLAAIRNPLRSLIQHTERYLTSAKKLTKAKAAGDALRNEYLAFTFGWGPLASDVDSAVQLYERLSGAQPNEKVYASSGKDLFMYSDEPNGAYVGVAGTSSYMRRNLKAVVKTTSFYRGALLAPLTDGISTGQSAGLSAADFLPTIWELLPWSFVADYFTNIGDVLQAASVQQTDFAWLSLTTRQEAWITVSPFLEKRSTVWKSSAVAGQVNLYSKYVHRRPSALVDLGFDSFELQLPSLKQGLNVAALAPNLYNLGRGLIPKFL